MKLPILNLSKGYSTDKLGKMMLKAASEHGFLYVAGHDVDISRAHSAMRDFFACSLEKKMTCHHSQTGVFRGYSGMFEQGNYGVDETDVRGESAAPVTSLMDFKEMFHIGTTLSKDHPLFNDVLYPENVWPENEKEFRSVIEKYYTDVLSLSNVMLELFAVALELPPKFFLKKSLSTPMNSMNCVHYPPLCEFPDPGQLQPEQLGIGEHSDFEVVTLLSQSGPTDPCLDIYVDNQWQAVPPLENHFVVNVGDLLARWSGDIFRSTIHRARNHENEHRYSIAFFRASDFDAVVSTDHVQNPKKRYDPVLAGDHMLARVNRANEVSYTEGSSS